MTSGALDPDAVQAYVDDGYLVVPGLLADADVARINHEIASFARGEYPAFNPLELPEGTSDAEATSHLLCVHFPHWVNDTIREYVSHPGVSAAVGQLAGAHLPHWDGSAKCMQSMLFVKPPGLPGQAWHQDEHYIPTRDRSLIGAWIALDDATVDNGCLWVLPGSHRTGYLYDVRDPEDLVEFDGGSEAFGFDDSGAVPVEVEAGDVVFFNGYLLHRSLRNRSTDSSRRALVNHYCNSWSQLPWDISGGIRRGDYRVVIPVAGEDPYAWKGYGEHPEAVFLREYTRADPAEV